MISAWKKSPRYNRIQAIDDNFTPVTYRKLTDALPKKHMAILTQLCMGHISLNHHLHRIKEVGNTMCLRQVRQPDTAPTPVNTTPAPVDIAPALGTGPTRTARPAGASQTCEDCRFWPNLWGSGVPDTLQGPDTCQLMCLSPLRGILDVEMGA